MARLSWMRTWLRASVVIGVIGLIVGCGQKGALVLPPADAPAKTPSTAPSPTHQGVVPHG